MARSESLQASVQVEGLADLDVALTQLPLSVAKKVLREVLKEAAEPIRATAQSLAPSRDAGDPNVYFNRGGSRVERRRGTAKALVQSGTKLTPRQQRTARREGKDSAEHYVGTRDRIAFLDEFGTSHSAAHPFMRPAWEQHAADALATIRIALTDRIEAARAKLARKAARLASKASG